MRTYLLTLGFLFAFNWSNAQAYGIRNFHEKHGLPNRFVTAIEQDKEGYLWVGTGEGLYSFDGFTFTSAIKGQAPSTISCSFMHADGSLWFGLNDGRLYKVVNQVCTEIDYGKDMPSKINQIATDNNQNIWILTQDRGIYLINSSGKTQHYNSGLEEFILYALLPLSANQAMLGTDMGLLHISLQSDNSITYEWNETIIETKVSAIASKGSLVVIGTEDQGLFTYRPSDGSIMSVQPPGIDLSRYQVNHIHLANESNWQLSTNNAGLIGVTYHAENQTFSVQSYGHEKDTDFRSLKTAFVDRENNLWLGTFGEGLAMIMDKSVSIHTNDPSVYTNNCLAVCTSPTQVFTSDFNKVLVCEGSLGNIVSTIEIGDASVENTITAIYADNNNMLWIGTQSNGLWNVNLTSGKKSKFQLSEDILNNQINDLTGFEEHLYVATEYGIFHIHQNILLKNVISMQSGLAHNAVRSMFRDSQGRIWLASTHNQVTYIADGIIQNIDTPFNGALIEITSFAEDQQKNIWAGTDGNGVFQLTGNNPKIYDTSKGLRSDHVYSMVVDPFNRLWITHRGAITRLDLANNVMKVIEPIDADDLQFPCNAIHASPDGKFFFGSDHGIVEYDFNKDSRVLVEPILQLRSLTINDSIYVGNNINLPHGDYQIQLDVIAISLQNPEGVVYQYFLEGYDSEWSAPTFDRQIVYNKLGDGNFVLRVKAFNAEGFGGSQEITINISIAIPFWKTWWFVVLTILAVIAIILLVIYSRERTLRQNQLNLKKALDERTKEVVKQKELLEISNKDIMDSIKYAKNIQQAMLPSRESLNQHFGDAFIYFKPRDIVSGDFYTIEKFNDIIVVSCADCTGHGVPGAFMSLIGSTILKEVTTDKSVQNASQVLVKLDGRLREMLNKQGATSVNDGMDISIFDYNTQTRKLRLASANRSTFLHHKGEWIELKGDRRNVGGSELANINDYLMHEYIIEPGDTIYLFSDGITDQFGGPLGKKIKKSGLLEWLQSIHHVSMQEQREFIKRKFKDWKSQHEQTDDVIIMGIRF